MDDMLALQAQEPGALVDLVIGAMDRELPGRASALIGATLDLMDDDALAVVVADAWRRARSTARSGTGSGSKSGGLSEMVKDVLEFASAQMPAVFQNDWDQLTALARVRGDGELNVTAAWRAMDDAAVADARRRLEGLSLTDPNHDKLVVALLHSRRPAVVREMAERGLAGRGTFPAFNGRSLLLMAGYDLDGAELRALHDERPLHLRLSAVQRKHMWAEIPEWKRAIWNVHPTFDVAGRAQAVATTAMGGTLGEICGFCHGSLHRLLCVADVGGAEVVTFGTCLSCQGWESSVLFYRHDAAGLPHPHESQCHLAPLTPEFVEEPLMEAKVELFRAPQRWAWQDWGASNNRQNLNRAGGPPAWVQSADHPECPDCQKTMAFVMQLDSHLPQRDGRGWAWGSGGCNYTFWCPSCRISAQLWQCT